MALIAVGVSGGIGAYKAAEVVRGLQKRGHDVVAILTRGAQQFVTPLTFEALTRRPPITDQWAAGLNADVGHISLTTEVSALVVAPGHGAGKASQYSWAANFARAGFLTLVIDPMGQGERMQHFDPELGTSKVEPSGEHEHANQTALLVGQHIARYWFADGIRSVDYLSSRPDVDAARIGTFGCSGGGTG